jgi:hypothetical protein
LNRSWLFILFIFSVTSISFPQTTPCDLTYKDGKGIRNARLIGLHQDLLLVSDTGSYKIVNIEKIKRIRFDKGTFVYMGAAFGAVAGLIGGLVYYEIFHKKTTPFFPKDASIGISLVFIIPGALLGGLVGNVFRNIDEYDLTDYGVYMKSKEIKFIMKEHERWR